MTSTDPSSNLSVAVAPVSGQQQQQSDVSSSVPMFSSVKSNSPANAGGVETTPTVMHTSLPQPPTLLTVQQHQQHVAPVPAPLSHPPVSNPLAPASITTATTQVADQAERFVVSSISPTSSSTTTAATTTAVTTDNTPTTSPGVSGAAVPLPLMQSPFLLGASALQQHHQPVSCLPAVSSVAVTPNHNTVAEFLYQLTKMLTDDNRDVIEWSNGKIEVHNPPKLASDVLHKYFRHSKYSSFQRQLNYFGFRKLAGKGKMAPCSYINEAATYDLRSLLSIKRKTSGSTPSSRKRDNAGNQDTKAATNTTGTTAGENIATSGGHHPQPLVAPPVNPVLAGILNSNDPIYGSNKRHRPSENDGPAVTIAVGKGVKHKLNGYLKGAPPTVSNAVAAAPAAPTISAGPTATASNSVASVANRNDPITIAKSAVGKGIPHRILQGPGRSDAAINNAAVTVTPENTETTNVATPSTATTPTLPPAQVSSCDSLGTLVPGNIEDSLTELTKNFQSAAADEPSVAEVSTDTGRNTPATTSVTPTPPVVENTVEPVDPCSNSQDPSPCLPRNSSLVDLAMIPPLYSVDPTPWSEMNNSGSIMGFVDFPHSEVDPSNIASLHNPPPP